jgi:tetratricopeptide (TPR) repeat protein
VDRDLPVRDLRGAEALLQWGQSENAVLAYDAILAQRPAWVPALVGRANLLARLGRREQSQRDLNLARQLSPVAADFFTAGSRYGLIAFIALYPRQWLDGKYGTGELPSTRTQSEERLLLAGLADRDDPDLLLVRAKLEGASLQLDDRLRHALDRRADAWSDFMLGNLALLKQDYLTAVRYYNDAFSAGADWPEMYYNRGLAEILQYSFSQGCADLAVSYQGGYAPALGLHTALCTY